MTSPAQERERVTNGVSRMSQVGIDAVIVLVTIAAYVTLLLNPDAAQLPAGTLALIIGLGVVYVVVGTYGWRVCERQGSSLAVVGYFSVQIALALAALALTVQFNSALWLLVLPVAGQSDALSRPGMVAVNGIILAGITVIFYQYGGWEAVTQASIGIAAGMAFVLVFTHIAIREQEARQEIERLAAELREANQQLREYAVQIEELATTKERNRLAREIHDSLGHHLTVMNVQLNAAQAVFDADREKALDALQKAQRMAQEGLQDVRRSVAALREAPIDGRPLPEVVAGLVAETEAAGVVAELDVLGEPRPGHPRTTLTLFRAAQEGLTNARKHAHASRVAVTLDYRAPDVVRLTIVDNGVGAGQTGGGFGLLGVRERVDLLGGDVEIETRPGEGFTLAVTVPG